MRYFLINLLIGIATADHMKQAIPNRCGSAQCLNVFELAIRMGQYSYLQAMKQTNNLHLLLQNGITVFMPTNDAFHNVSKKTREFWHAHPEYYKQLMSYHIISERRDKSDLNDEASYATLAGHNLTARYIDYKLMSKNVQLYNDAQIGSFNHEASNGVIHLLDNVVGHIQNDTMFNIVKGREELSEILHAVRVAKIIGVLGGSNAYTFAAPTNEAIAKLGKEIWGHYLSHPAMLKKVLSYHIAKAGTWMIRGLTDKMKVETLFENNLWTVRYSNSSFLIGHGRLITTDLSATNGVVHTIDKVLLPHGETFY